MRPLASFWAHFASSGRAKWHQKGHERGRLFASHCLQLILAARFSCGPTFRRRRRRRRKARAPQADRSLPWPPASLELGRSLAFKPDTHPHTNQSNWTTFSRGISCCRAPRFFGSRLLTCSLRAKWRQFARLLRRPHGTRALSLSLSMALKRAPRARACRLERL